MTNGWESSSEKKEVHSFNSLEQLFEIAIKIRNNIAYVNGFFADASRELAPKDRAETEAENFKSTEVENIINNVVNEVDKKSATIQIPAEEHFVNRENKEITIKTPKPEEAPKVEEIKLWNSASAEATSVVLEKDATQRMLIFKPQGELGKIRALDGSPLILKQDLETSNLFTETSKGNHEILWAEGQEGKTPKNSIIFMGSILGNGSDPLLTLIITLLLKLRFPDNVHILADYPERDDNIAINNFSIAYTQKFSPDSFKPTMNDNFRSIIHSFPNTAYDLKNNTLFIPGANPKNVSQKLQIIKDKKLILEGEKLILEDKKLILEEQIPKKEIISEFYLRKNLEEINKLDHNGYVNVGKINSVFLDSLISFYKTSPNQPNIIYGRETLLPEQPKQISPLEYAKLLGYNEEKFKKTIAAIEKAFAKGIPSPSSNDNSEKIIINASEINSRYFGQDISRDFLLTSLAEYINSHEFDAQWKLGDIRPSDVERLLIYYVQTQNTIGRQLNLTPANDKSIKNSANMLSKLLTPIITPIKFIARSLKESSSKDNKTKIDKTSPGGEQYKRKKSVSSIKTQPPKSKIGGPTITSDDSDDNDII